VSATRLRAFARGNSLSIFFLVIFLGALAGQAVAGHNLFNEDAVLHGEQQVSMWRYLTSSDFAQAVTENWQSEYLQFALFALATVWFVQRGSPESKEPGKAGTESDEDQQVGRFAGKDAPPWAKAGGVKTAIYSNSLIIVMACIFLASWAAQSLNGWRSFNEAQVEHSAATVSWLGYLGSSEFWEATLQNWQSEFLAVGSFAVIAIYLRQRGSPESKPVGSPSEGATGNEG
jgi:membrane protein implicated in regulation of membrane protease activity